MQHTCQHSEWWIMMTKVSGVCLCVCPCEQLWLEVFLDWTWACEGWWRGQSSVQYWGKFGLCSHKCLFTTVPHPDSPTHQLFTPTNVNLISNIHRSCCFLSPLFFKTCIFACVCVCVHVHARVLESSEHSGSQLRSSQQPSVAQLNPLPPPHPPLLTVPEGLMCTAEGHVLGTRARRQAKAAAARLHFDHLCYSSLSSPSTMVWSGLMLPSSLSSTLSSLSLSHFSLVLWPLSAECTEPRAHLNLIV